MSSQRHFLYWTKYRCRKRTKPIFRLLIESRGLHFQRQFSFLVNVIPLCLFSVCNANLLPLPALHAHVYRNRHKCFKCTGAQQANSYGYIAKCVLTWCTAGDCIYETVEWFWWSVLKHLQKWILHVNFGMLSSKERWNRFLLKKKSWNFVLEGFHRLEWIEYVSVTLVFILHWLWYSHNWWPFTLQIWLIDSIGNCQFSLSSGFKWKSVLSIRGKLGWSI